MEFIHANIEEYFERIDKNQVLKNVLSSMVHIKQESDKCETYLTTVSEPLTAFCEKKLS